MRNTPTSIRSADDATCRAEQVNDLKMRNFSIALLVAAGLLIVAAPGKALA